jgi:hypothetical protein
MPLPLLNRAVVGYPPASASAPFVGLIRGGVRATRLRGSAVRLSPFTGAAAHDDQSRIAFAARVNEPERRRDKDPARCTMLAPVTSAVTLYKIGWPSCLAIDEAAWRCAAPTAHRSSSAFRTTLHGALEAAR